MDSTISWEGEPLPEFSTDDAEWITDRVSFLTAESALTLPVSSENTVSRDSPSPQRLVLRNDEYDRYQHVSTMFPRAI